MAKDYRRHQSDENVLADNLWMLGAIVVGAAGLIAGAGGLFGWKAVSSLAADTAVNLKQELTDNVFVELYEKDILAYNPRLGKSTTLAARVINLVDNGEPVLVCQVEKRKGQRPRLVRYRRGRVAIRYMTSGPYVFSVDDGSKSEDQPLLFTLRDVRNIIEASGAGVLCLAVAK
jgi:hypothetical protein